MTKREMLEEVHRILAAQTGRISHMLLQSKLLRRDTTEMEHALLRAQTLMRKISTE